MAIINREITRNSSILEDRHQAVVQKHLANLNKKIKNLELKLKTRGQTLQSIGLSTIGDDDSVARNGEKCLSSAITAQDMSTAEPGSEDIDEAYGSDSSHPSSIFETADGFTVDALTRLINDCLHEAQRYRRLEQYDEAIVRQGEAISYAKQRERSYGIELRDELTMLKTLADLNLQCHRYLDATAIFERLLTEEQDPSRIATLKHKLGDAYLAHGTYGSAAGHANEANNWKQINLKKGDDSIIETLTLLSTIYDMMGRRNVSKEFACEALQHQVLKQGKYDEEIENAIKKELTPQEVQDILDKENDINGRGILALKAFHLAVAFNQVETVKQLWDSYPTVQMGTEVPNGIGMTPLISATSWGHEAIVKFLLETGKANVNARFSSNFSEDTALIIAADKQFKSIVQMLLNHEANAQDSNQHGRTAIHRAMGPPVDDNDATRTAIVKLLLLKDREALLEARCEADKHALHIAAEAGNKPMIKLLLAQGAQIEATDCAGRTPLFCAIDSGQAAAVEALVNQGADLGATDNLGRTVWKAANRPVGDARKICRILKAAKEARAENGNNSAAYMSQLVGGSRLSLSLQPTPSQSSSISMLKPPNETPCIFESSVESPGTTIWRQGGSVGSKIGRLLGRPGHRVNLGNKRVIAERGTPN